VTCGTNQGDGKGRFAPLRAGGKLRPVALRGLRPRGVLGGWAFSYGRGTTLLLPSVWVRYPCTALLGLRALRGLDYLFQYPTYDCLPLPGVCRSTVTRGSGTRDEETLPSHLGQTHPCTLCLTPHPLTSLLPELFSPQPSIQHPEPQNIHRKGVKVEKLDAMKFST
jgi:hypothetical protein